MPQTIPATSDLAAQLVERARAMIPALRARAASCETERKVYDDTIRDFQDAGFFKILQPKRYGGYELDPQVFYAVQMTVAEGCMSSAWVLGVVAIHNWQLALFDDRAAQLDLIDAYPNIERRALFHIPRRNQARERPPLMPIDGAEIAVLIGPFIPDAHAILFEIADIGIAGEEPQQLVDNRAQMQLLGCHQREPVFERIARLKAEIGERASARAI